MSCLLYYSVSTESCAIFWFWATIIAALCIAWLMACLYEGIKWLRKNPVGIVVVILLFVIFESLYRSY